MSVQIKSGPENIDIEQIPFKKRIEAFYKETCAATELARQVMIPLLKALINPSKKEEIINGLYYRMYAWMLALEALKNTVYFQAVASATRSIFELLLDLKLLIEDKPKNSIEKFEAFIQIEKFRVAKKYVEFKAANPGLKCKSGLAKEKLVNKSGEEDRINRLIVSNWGKDKKGKPIKIEHWTGWKISKRAQEAGKDYEYFYHESFALLSWYLHSGLVGIKGMSTESLEVVFGNSHMLVTPLFLDATLLVAEELKLLKAIPQLIDWIKKVKLVAGEVIIEEHLKILESTSLSK